MSKTLLLLDLEDRYFLSHRRALAIAAREAGFRVVVCVRIGGNYMERIRAEGFECFALWSENRRGIRFHEELLALLRLIRAYRTYRPEIAHHFGIRNLVHGALAARIAKTPFVVNSFLGLGSLFAAGSLKLHLLRRIVLVLLKNFHRRNNTLAIVQNHDDKEVIFDSVLSDESRLCVVRGSGVDVRSFRPAPEPPGVPLVVLASRMLAEKGVYEFVEAAASFKKEGLNIRMALVGSPDPKNPSSISESALSKWDQEGEVEWWGYREDMPEVWRSCHIAVLPTYYKEGLPKSLLEAAACGRPLVATDVPGCREVLKDGVNGISVPPRDPEALAGAIRKLAGDFNMRRRMSAAGRRIVETDFSDEVVSEKILKLYRRMSRTENEQGK